jgi:site-specific recombinase XerD
VIASNPVAHADKPAQRRTRQPYLILPDRVEAMRAHMLAAGRERDVVLLELLAYAGLRPESEAITLTWRQVRARSLLIVDTKRGTERSDPLVDQLADALVVWRVRSGGRDRQLVIPARPGHSWTDGTRGEWRYWRRHVFAPAATAAGLPADVRPRDLRGSFVSLLINEGRSVVEVARICGHGPEVCLRDYAQVIDEYDPAYRRSAAVVIAEARDRATGFSGLVFPQSSAKESA